MLLTGRNLTKHYGPRLLFSGITIGLSEGECVGLIGANGSGKSTLLRIFAGIEQADEGELIARRQLRVGYVPQEDSFAPDATCIDLVADQIDSHLDDHERHIRAGLILDRAGFVDATATVATLSGGWKKRLAIVRQLAREPDLLLMDEPTNHLDVDGILWLEKLIANASFATLIVSHDRRFLETVANRIIELGRAYPAGFLSYDGSYSNFLEKREEFLQAQLGRERALASGVRREVEWLRRGAKARTTKAKGRIERANEMMSDLANLRERNTQAGAAKIDFTASDRKTRKLVELKHVRKSLAGRELFKDVNVILSPGTKLGLLGPNGSGKSTLIRLIAAEIESDAGEIFRADQLRVVVFDQHREQLDPNQTLRRALSPGGDNLVVNGVAMHVMGWAKRFLFRPEQLDMPVGELSGGEQARVLIARLMVQPADVLILDEPTNDLDIATLDVLEESLEQFPGALVLVTHDRYLLERVCTEILALDGKGNANIYVGLAQWERARDEAEQAELAAKKSAQQLKAPATERPKPSSEKKRLTWNEQRELEKMETTILAAESEVQSLQTRVADPKVMADHVQLHEAYDKLATAQHEVERLYARWADLESRKS
ncbi:MAG TPA: ABC-F family ATP-binding cassette domain-containing protein [Tepidisphaeraceae bacterium]|jgi:ATP-binding cassette subfamily F protein uup|nr:ABC-F family ATP-binding cassette domain-containing protein [Tepidisphaeraceae bacterium]